MDTDERREASAAFSETLRAKWAESRRGLRPEDLMGTDRGEDDSTAERPREEGDRQ